MTNNKKCAVFAIAFACLSLALMAQVVFMLPTMAEVMSVPMVILIASILSGACVLCAHESVKWLGEIDA